ncbi:hypothetical protein AVEN_179603-2 [Araneus ventricosus]|uniref:Uncharacterized protein n=1 Tax=Araneus ventricosus TaxID=182803 RepID=A0A4Y2BCA1_ARAVE|nr:hypothetical protein AVEN_179603-2 [Araneus ventricosus]
MTIFIALKKVEVVSKPVTYSNCHLYPACGISNDNDHSNPSRPKVGYETTVGARRNRTMLPDRVTYRNQRENTRTSRCGKAMTLDSVL